MGEFRTWHRKEDLGWNTGAGLTELVSSREREWIYEAKYNTE